MPIAAVLTSVADSSMTSSPVGVGLRSRSSLATIHQPMNSGMLATDHRNESTT